MWRQKVQTKKTASPPLRVGAKRKAKARDPRVQPQVPVQAQERARAQAKGKEKKAREARELGKARTNTRRSPMRRAEAEAMEEVVQEVEVVARPETEAKAKTGEWPKRA